MTHPYASIINHEGSWEEFFDRYMFAKIFQPLWEYYEDKSTAVKIIKFIVYAFSLDSTKITVTGDRRIELSDLFKELEIDKKLYEDVVLFSEIKIKECADKWLKFQDNAQLEYLLTLKTAYMQQQSASLSPLKKADGINVDYDQKHKCIEHMRELKEWIKEAEQELIQNNPKLKEAFSDLHKTTFNKRRSTGKGIESYIKEHENGNSE